MRIVIRHFKDCFAKQVRTPRTVPHSEAGLTLIEMMIVLVIIAIVSGLIVVNVMGRPDDARATRVKGDIGTLSTALAMYRLDNGNYPTTEQGLKALAEKPSAAPVPEAWRNYVSETPADPWGNPYTYSTDGSSYTITSLGRDGKPGGEGVDADISETRQ